MIDEVKTSGEPDEAPVLDGRIDLEQADAAGRSAWAGSPGVHAGAAVTRPAGGAGLDWAHSMSAVHRRRQAQSAFIRILLRFTKFA